MQTTAVPSRDTDRERLTQAIRDLDIALNLAQQRSQKWLAWQQLNVTDDRGINNVKPYTSTAIATLEATYKLDESDYSVIHHLAIAYHSMAWDLELREPDESSGAWQKALFYWSKLQSCQTFWQDLCEKGEKLGKEFDKNIIENFRQNLVKYLVEIHVDFIQYYCYELKRFDQAARHIELIKRAQIPHAYRKELTNLAYEAIKSAVLDVADEGNFDYALLMLDDFLNLFPNYEVTIQKYLEITKRWLEQISPLQEWQEILELEERVFLKFESLKASKHYLSKNPLAQVALGNLASTLGNKYWVKARTQRDKVKPLPKTLECEEYGLYEKAIIWLKEANIYTPDNLEMKWDLFNTLYNRAVFTFHISQSIDDFDVTCQLLDQALSDCQEASKIFPDETLPYRLSEQISQIKGYS